MKGIAVLLMGCGGVGRQLLQHVVSCRSLHAKQGLRLRVVGVCDSKSFLVASDVSKMELNDALLMEICRLKSSASSLSTLSSSDFGGSHFFYISSPRMGEHQIFTNMESTRKILDTATLLGRSTGLAFVDCSASSEAIGVLTHVIDMGCCVVLANKKPLTSSLVEYEKLVSHPRRIRHESTEYVICIKESETESLCLPTRDGRGNGGHASSRSWVGAGLPVITSLNRILASGDPIHRIIGSLSGTLGYVMSEVGDGKPLSEVVRAAKSLGYTEPDPRDDLGGMDVARKALILARLLRWRINMDNIKVESLYPDEMGPDRMSVEDFLANGLPLLDKDIETRFRVASSNGNVLRYVCIIEGSSCQVGIKELPKDSPLGRLRGSDNVLEIYSRCYNDLPLVIQGAGAGNDTTAAGVLADILDLQDLFP